MKIIDLHCDTLSKMAENNNYSFQKNNGHIDKEKLACGLVSAQCFAAFCKGEGEAAYKSYQKQKRIFEKIKRDKGIKAVFTIENAEMLNGKIKRLKKLDGKVKLLGLVWNNENCIGYPNSSDKEINALPLKSFGKEVIEQLNHTNILPDVSHLNVGGFWDVINLGRQSVVASHSNCKEIYPHPRNLDDAQLRAIAQTGGVVGINFYSLFLGKEKTTAEDIVRQALHIKNVAGIEAVALGSDFDGMDCELSFSDASGYPQIVEKLLERFSYSEVEKICHKNAERILFKT